MPFEGEGCAMVEGWPWKDLSLFCCWLSVFHLRLERGREEKGEVLASRGGSFSFDLPDVHPGTNSEDKGKALTLVVLRYFLLSFLQLSPHFRAVPMSSGLVSTSISSMGMWLSELEPESSAHPLHIGSLVKNE